MKSREYRSNGDQCERNEMDESVRLFYGERHEEEYDQRNL
jgi:hypothetical protein